MTDILQQIRDLQFTDKALAETLLLAFIRDVFPQLDVAKTEIRPLAVSLNSFNGFLTLADGERLFFKTHTEADNVIGEYYRAGVLAKAGYPVIQPLYQSGEAGKHLLIYPAITAPSVFELAWEIENGDTTHLQKLMHAQEAEDVKLFERYKSTLSMQSAEDAAVAPIHQLFHHRLTRGRFERFYGQDNVAVLPHQTIATNDLWNIKWTINGKHYKDTLRQIIDRAIDVLTPNQSQPAIIGHGDAHNGNVFLIDDALVYFDPAFAGSHSPLLDLVKPLFHNVFAMWMYYPNEIASHLNIETKVSGEHWQITYDYVLPEIRMFFWQSKVTHTLLPILRLLKQQDMLRPDWQAYLKAALFCCPFLTMNLADTERFPPKITLLGLTMAVEMGAFSEDHTSFLDRELIKIQHELDKG